MSTMQDKVRAFHEALGVTVGDSPAIRDRKLRAELIMEEAREFVDAVGCMHDDPCHEPDLVAAADALGDLLYVVFGAAVTFGIDMDAIFDEVHRSNMTKVGGPVRADGKRLKPDTYEPPNLAPLLTTKSRPTGRHLPSRSGQDGSGSADNRDQTG